MTQARAHAKVCDAAKILAYNVSDYANILAIS